MVIFLGTLWVTDMQLLPPEGPLKSSSLNKVRDKRQCSHVEKAQNEKDFAAMCPGRDEQLAG